MMAGKKILDILFNIGIAAGSLACFWTFLWLGLHSPSLSYEKPKKPIKKNETCLQPQLPRTNRVNYYLESLVESLKTELTKKTLNYFFVVDKSEYRLNLYKPDGKKSYRTVLGTNPVDDKKILGDHCTPEGLYYICAKNPNSLYYKAFVFNYPNPKDAEDGLKRGIINKQEYNKIIKTFKQKRTPPLDTKLGPGLPLEIHGCPKPFRLYYNWTGGCVAVSNSTMDKIYDKTDLWTPLIIKP